MSTLRYETDINPTAAARQAAADRDALARLQAAAAHATRVVGRVVPTEDASAEREGRSRDASAELRTSRTPRTPRR